MRLELLPPLGAGLDTGGAAIKRDVGAAVVRAAQTGGLLLELGPADGPPMVRLSFSTAEAARLSNTLHTIGANGGEAILMVDD